MASQSPWPSQTNADQPSSPPPSSPPPSSPPPLSPSLSPSLSSQPPSSTPTHTNKRLFACYLLVSHATSRSQRTYIGFTVNPSRRLKQHNGLIRYGGAYRTKKHRPWYNVAVIHGFSCKTQALQFEWAWQHPQRSLVLKAHNANAIPLPTKRKTSVQGSLQTLAALVSVPPWSLCPLTLTICAERPLWKQYGIESLTLPPHFRVAFSHLQSFDSLATCYDYRHAIDSVIPQYATHNKCPVCQLQIVARHQSNANSKLPACCASCGAVYHLTCLSTLRSTTQPQEAEQNENEDNGQGNQQPNQMSLLPTTVTCKQCHTHLHWSLVVRLAHALQSDDD